MFYLHSNGKLALVAILLLLCGVSTFAQKSIAKYEFPNHKVILSKEELLTGKKVEQNDTCYFIFKFYQNNNGRINVKLIEKVKYCNGKASSPVFYTVPKKVTKYYYVTYKPDPPYEQVTLKAKKYVLFDKPIE